jgi:hypothetical protein
LSALVTIDEFLDVPMHMLSGVAKTAFTVYNVNVEIHKRRALRRIMKSNNKCYVPSTTDDCDTVEEDNTQATENSGRKGRDQQNYKTIGSIEQALNNGRPLSCYRVGHRVIVGLRRGDTEAGRQSNGTMAVL